MNNLILDTNILHQEGLHSRNMQLLMRLSAEQHVQIHIPELVKREYLTKRVSESIEKIQEAHNKISHITKKLKKDNSLQAHTLEAQNTLRKIEALLEPEVTKEFDLWVKHFNITIIPIDQNCLSTVIDDYFLGNGVYKKPKNREDIPDAIINSSIMALLKEKQFLTVILKDGAFKKHLSSVRGIAVFDSVDEFLLQKENKDKLDELDSLYETIDSIKDYLITKEPSSSIEQYLISARTDIEDIYLESEQISSTDKLEITTFGENINYPEAETISEFNICNVAWLTEGVFSLEVDFKAEATLGYCGHYGEYIYLEEDAEREISFDSMSGDGICDLSEARSFKFTGYLQLFIDGELDIEAIKKHIKNIGEDGNPIQLSLDIEYADIQ